MTLKITGVFDSIKAVLARYPNSYVSFVKTGNCMICGKQEDLRCGVCFGCAPSVDGEKINGGHRLWQKDKPENTWYVGDP